jgi:hypothetical protein
LDRQNKTGDQEIKRIVGVFQQAPDLLISWSRTRT